MGTSKYGDEFKHDAVQQTRDAARQDVFDYIEMFYNPKRIGLMIQPR
jgi:hypothetical protein